MCIANIFNTGGGANMSASPVSSSAGTLIDSSFANVITFFNGCGWGAPAWRLIFSSSIHFRVPSGLAARYDADTSRSSGGIAVNSAGRNRRPSSRKSGSCTRRMLACAETDGIQTKAAAAGDADRHGHLHGRLHAAGDQVQRAPRRRGQAHGPFCGAAARAAPEEESVSRIRAGPAGRLRDDV